MTRTFYSLLLGSVCFLLLAGTGCQEEPAETELLATRAAEAEAAGTEEANAVAVEVNELPPKVVFEKVVHDFGDISPASKNTCAFKFTNEGPGILKVNKKVKSTCGCAVPNLSKEKYLPGETGTISVTFRPGRKTGRQSKSLYASTNDPRNKKVQLKLKAKVVEKVKLDPKQLALRLDKDNAGCPDITISSTDNAQFAITRITSTSQVITAEYDGNTKASEFVLNPKVDLEKLAKTNRGQITIYLTHPVQDKLSVSFSAPPKFKAEPATLVALKAQPGQPIRKTVYILSTYNEPFEVEAVKPKNDIIKVASLEPVDEKRYKIDVDIIPPEMGGKRHFESGLTIEIVGGDILTINCIGRFARTQQAKL